MRYKLTLAALFGAAGTAACGVEAPDAGDYDQAELRTVQAALTAEADLLGRIEAEDYTRAYELSSANEGGQCDRGDGVDMQLASDPTGGNCNIGWTSDGEWLEYDVTVPSTGRYNLTARVASAYPDRAISISVDGVPQGTITTPSDGWQDWGDSVLYSLTLTEGVSTIRFSFDNGESNLNYFGLSKVENEPCALEPLELSSPTASSSEASVFSATNALDGNDNTRWSSSFSDPQWISVDLGSEQRISQVILDWETASSADYEIQVSNDGVNFTTVYSDPAGDGGIDTVDLAGVSGRYVRMYSNARTTQWGVSLWEMSVNGCAGPETFTTEDATYIVGPHTKEDGTFANTEVRFDDAYGWTSYEEPIDNPPVYSWLTNPPYYFQDGPLLLDTAELVGMYVRRCGTGEWVDITSTRYAPYSNSPLSYEDGTYSIETVYPIENGDQLLDPEFICAEDGSLAPLSPMVYNGQVVDAVHNGYAQFAFVVEHTTEPAPAPGPDIGPGFDSSVYSSPDFEAYCDDVYGASASAGRSGNHAHEWFCQVGTQQYPLDMEAACDSQYSPQHRAVLLGGHANDWGCTDWVDAENKVVPVVIVSATHASDPTAVSEAVQTIARVARNTRDWYANVMASGATYTLVRPVVVLSSEDDDYWNNLSCISAKPEDRPAECPDPSATQDRWQYFFAASGAAQGEFVNKPSTLELPVPVFVFTGPDASPFWLGAGALTYSSGIGISVLPPRYGACEPNDFYCGIYGHGHELGHNFGLGHTGDLVPQPENYHDSIMQNGGNKADTMTLFDAEQAVLDASPYFY